MMWHLEILFLLSPEGNRTLKSKSHFSYLTINSKVSFSTCDPLTPPVSFNINVPKEFKTSSALGVASC